MACADEAGVQERFVRLGPYGGGEIERHGSRGIGTLCRRRLGHVSYTTLV